MNNISQKQNTDQCLRLLAAQRQLYSDAKQLQTVSIFMSVPIAIVWSVLTAIFPSLTVYAAAWGFLIPLLEMLYLSPSRKSTQEKAAKIQQMFDSEIFQLNWERFNCGTRIEPETINESSDRYRNKRPNTNQLQDWYPASVDQLPVHLARIVCQRSNVWWDAQLRRRYSKWIVGTLISLTVIVLIFGLIGGLSLTEFILAVIAPLMPAFFFGVRQYNGHREAATSLDRLRECAETLFDEATLGRYTQQVLEEKSYSLQAKIYDNRRSNPLIPEWLYERLRDKNEENMNKGADFFIQELIQAPSLK